MIETKKVLKNAKKDNSLLPLIGKIAVLGDCSTQLFSMALQGYAYEYGYRLEILDAGYDQIELQLFNHNSEVHTFSPHFILLYLCTERLYERFCLTEFEKKEHFAEEEYNKIENYWKVKGNIENSSFLQVMFNEVDDRIFGNFAGKTTKSFLYQIRKLNLLIMEGSQHFKNIYLVEFPFIQNQFGRKRCFQENNYYASKIPYSLDILPQMAKSVMDMLLVFKGKIVKCVVLDLDNTIWGGIIGDDGIEGIQIGELGIGRVFHDFQLWLKELKNRGIILAVCSKNNEEIAKLPFLQHPDMILRLEDISLFVANWEDKVKNIRWIQQTLNIGMDSILFLDDNPFERNLVRDMIPEIVVPELPEDPAMYLSYLKDSNFFETISFSDEDEIRTKQYQAEIKRNDIKQKFASFEDYLAELSMIAEIKKFDEFHYPRIAQLMQRSNQFNVRTIRYTEAEIEEIAKDDHFISLYFTLKDKYGDYGLISAVILEKKEDSSLFITNWVMSCRVLKRGMEEFIINKIVEIASKLGAKRIISEYRRTLKNQLIKEIYEKLGFIELEDNLFELLLDSYQEKTTFIKEEQEKN